MQFLFGYNDNIKISHPKILTIMTVILLVMGLVVVSLCAIETWHVAVLWGLACWSVGMTVGFLFGIPRRLIKSKTGDIDTTKIQSGFGHVNTNLERISDWLTSIIVGYGLIELRKIPDALNRLAQHAAMGLKSRSLDETSFATALIIYFLVFSFIAGYLLTRVYLAPAFKDADEKSKPE